MGTLGPRKNSGRFTLNRSPEARHDNLVDLVEEYVLDLFIYF